MIHLVSNARPLPLLLVILGCSTSDAGGMVGQIAFERVEVEVGAQTAALVTTDIDRDGRMDLIAAAGDYVVVLSNAGEGHFEVSQRLDVGPGAVHLAVADLDGDATPDVVIANHETTYITTLFGTPAGLVARGDPRLQVDVDPHPHAVALDDVDGDGLMDVLVDDRGRESLRVFPGRGDGTFGEPFLINVGGDPYRGFLLSDLGDDGRLDIVTPNPRHVAVTVGIDSGAFAEPAALETGFDPFSVAIGDFDGDGRTDLAAGSGEGSGSIAVWNGREDGSFGPAARYEIAVGPTSSAAADLDGDGRDELLVSSYIGGEVAVLSGGQLQRIRLDGSPYGLTSGDLDGDGLNDFAVANDATSHITLFLTRSN